jgi:hypothetical protein
VQSSDADVLPVDRFGAPIRMLRVLPLRARHAVSLLVLVVVIVTMLFEQRGRHAGVATIARVDVAAAPGQPRRAPPPIVPGTPQFGLNTHLMWEGPARAAVDLERIAAAGQTVVRFDVGWDGFEPTGKSEWSEAYLARLDHILDLVERRGLHPIVVVVGTPAWARGGLGSRMTPPDRPEDFADAVGHLAARYADRPSIAYEIWNEPNQDDFWDTESGPDARAYAEMLKASNARIKGAAPDAIVLGGSVAFNDREYLEQLYAAPGVVGSFDALALHPYTLAYPPEQVADQAHSFALAIESASEVMAAHGDADRPIWITELGWSTQLVGEAVRAEYLGRAVELIRRSPQVAVACVYQLRQDQDLPEFGLITASGTPTDSWGALVQAVAAPSSSGHPRGTIDTPVENAELRGTPTVTGWALDEAATDGTGVDRVRVLLSGIEVGEATLGQARPDIAAAYGPSFATAGFQAALDLARAAPGQHTVEVRAHSTVTGREMAYVRAIRVVP